MPKFLDVPSWYNSHGDIINGAGSVIVTAISGGTTDLNSMKPGVKYDIYLPNDLSGGYDFLLFTAGDKEIHFSFTQATNSMGGLQASNLKLCSITLEIENNSSFPGSTSQFYLIEGGYLSGTVSGTSQDWSAVRFNYSPGNKSCINATLWMGTMSISLSYNLTGISSVNGSNGAYFNLYCPTVQPGGVGMVPMCNSLSPMNIGWTTPFLFTAGQGSSFNIYSTIRGGGIAFVVSNGDFTIQGTSTQILMDNAIIYSCGNQTAGGYVILCADTNKSRYLQGEGSNLNITAASGKTLYYYYAKF